MKKLSSLPELQSKEKSSYPSSIGVESIQDSTENDHLYNVVSKLTLEELSKKPGKDDLKWEMQRKDKSVNTGKSDLET